MEYDLFISYASEDKEDVVRPLATSLADYDVKVWFDETELKPGDSLIRTIDAGLSNSRFGVVILSESFFRKDWPEYELRGLTIREIGGDKVVIPVWYRIEAKDVIKHSPPLADKKAIVAGGESIQAVAERVIEVVRPDIYESITRRKIWKRMTKSDPSNTVAVPLSRLNFLPVPRHKRLKDSVLVRIKLIHYLFADLLDDDLSGSIDLYKAEVYPEDELEIWEKFAVAFIESMSFIAADGRDPSDLRTRKAVLSALLAFSVGSVKEENVSSFKPLSREDVLKIGTCYLYSVPREESEDGAA